MALLVSWRFSCLVGFITVSRVSAGRCSSSRTASSSGSAGSCRRTRKPGLTFIRPIGDRLQKVNKQIVAMAVPAQEGITKDNVSVRVDAVVYFKVVDPIKATINVQNYMFAVSQRAQTSLRSIIGQSEMQQLLDDRVTVNRELCRIIDEGTEDPWGVKVGERRDQGRVAARGHEALDATAGRGRT